METGIITSAQPSSATVSATPEQGVGFAALLEGIAAQVVQPGLSAAAPPGPEPPPASAPVEGSEAQRQTAGTLKLDPLPKKERETAQPDTASALPAPFGAIPCRFRSQA